MGLEHAIFCCLRWELLRLFRNAVKRVPERERLVITLRYRADLGERKIGLTLDIEESTLTRLSASASLHLGAWLFGSRETDHLQWPSHACRLRAEKLPQAHRPGGPHLYVNESKRVAALRPLLGTSRIECQIRSQCTELVLRG
jgi:hypothetical protein